MFVKFLLFSVRVLYSKEIPGPDAPVQIDMGALDLLEFSIPICKIVFQERQRPCEENYNKEKVDKAFKSLQKIGYERVDSVEP